ncbi:transmembrane protein 132C isoform X2 [Denticeps clupeoides]|uniref:Transmembrane protein family 132 middle domain-containing protein n=1 Tax=Denticeps clupeoides TaxID=299321 RepID=A0AAY4A4S6_9TELE|nr:transmembrane protein 132C-like isoform X2 [Denticeps clupeoides]
MRDTVMDADSCRSPCRSEDIMELFILLHWFCALACSQPPPSLSLPAHITVPSPWDALPLLHSDLGDLFSNSSPFAFTQSLLLLPPTEENSKAGVRASFGPYSVTQLLSEPVPALSPLLSASLLTKYVGYDREEYKREKFDVQVLFHMRGSANRGSCVTLHAFKETENQRGSCIIQPPLGLCVVSLTLPKDWFESEEWHVNHGQNHRQRHGNRHHTHSHNHRRHQNYIAGAIRNNPNQHTQHIQLYYSSFGTASNLRPLPTGCEANKPDQSQSKLYYIGSVPIQEKGDQMNKTRQGTGCSGEQEEEELKLDYNVMVRHHRGPVRVGQPIRMSVNLRSNFTGDSIIIRLKVKKGLLAFDAQPSIMPGLWAVDLERTTGSKHDTISIICQRIGTLIDIYSSNQLRQVTCLLVDGLQNSFGVAMTVTITWWVEYSSRNSAASPYGAVTSFISFTDREMNGIAPITESNTIINTAILTSQPVSLPVIVLGVGNDGKVSDVTSAVLCHTENEDIIKVSSDCSLLFVDGSESGIGSTCVGVNFHMGTFSGSLCLSVWAPVVPLRISLSDPVLSTIDGWSYHTEHGCTPVFQRSIVRVQAQFSAQPSSRDSQISYMLGSPEWFVDVTELVQDWLRVENPYVAAINKQGYLIGLEPGVTSINIISSQWDGVLGSAEVFVSAEPVTAGDLSVQVVGGLGLSVNLNPTHPCIVTATVTAHNILYNLGQEAAISIWLQFSDDTAILISAFSDLPYSLRLSSLAETVVAVTPDPSHRVHAQGDGGGPLLKAELFVSRCESTSNHIDSSTEWDTDGTRRLAKGSGWIRVNLDNDLWSENSDFEIFDVSEMLVESDKDLYNNFGDKSVLENTTSDYDVNAGNGMIVRNDLERAVLTPKHEEGAVYISPGTEREGKRQKQGDKELEVGFGAVASLLCLFVFLFLVNCLPCVWRERQKRKQEENESDVERMHSCIEDKDNDNDKENYKDIVKREDRIRQKGETE